MNRNNSNRNNNQTEKLNIASLFKSKPNRFNNDDITLTTTINRCNQSNQIFNRGRTNELYL